MQPSIELSCRDSKQRMNIKVLTQIRQNFQDLKDTGSSFRPTRPKLHKNLERETSRLYVTHHSTTKKNQLHWKSNYRKYGGWLPTTTRNDVNGRLQAAKEEIVSSHQKRQQSKSGIPMQVLQQVFQIGELINQNFYNYRGVEYSIKELNKKVKELKSPSSEFLCYVISALILYEYSSLSLTIFYFDKALKTLHNKKSRSFNYAYELLVYRYSAKVFLQTNSRKEAKQLAYMYLRKCWCYFNLDEEMNAYDLLGQIELEEGNIEMSRYFHWRMCHAVRESKEIVQISNQELAKLEKGRYEFSSYEDITSFIRNEGGIVDILENHFRAEAEEETKVFNNRWKNKPVYLYTHRSSNRVLHNHRSLERRMTDEKQSKELHFIRPKDIKKLRKLITELNTFVFDLKRLWEIEAARNSMENTKPIFFDTP